MKISRAGKQNHAWWRMEFKLQKRFEKEGIDFQTIQHMIRGAACGWDAGYRYRTRHPKTKRPKK